MICSSSLMSSNTYEQRGASSPQSSRSTSLESCEMLDFLRDQDETHPSQTYFQSAIDKQASILQATAPVNLTRWQYGLQLSQVAQYLADAQLPVRNVTTAMIDEASISREQRFSISSEIASLSARSPPTFSFSSNRLHQRYTTTFSSSLSF